MKKNFIRTIKRRHKKVLRRSRFLLRHPLIVPVLTFNALFLFGLVGFVALGGSTQGPADARIVNVYVDGEQRTVTTRAKTVGDLLNRLEVPLVAEDIIEPASDSLILEDDTQVNIYRARPVEVIDGNRTVTLYTAQRAPRLVAQEAGFVLLDEDAVTFERQSNSIQNAVVAEQVFIDRSIEITLNVYGAIRLMRTTADNVDEVLKSQNVSPAEGESVQPSLTTSVSSGMLISVNRPGVKTAVVNEQIAFAVETKDDPALDVGKTRLDSAGVVGERAVVYEIVEQAGVETSRKEIQQVILREPKNEQRSRGVKIVVPSFSSTETVSGDKSTLMSAAGISESDFTYVDYIVTKESRWRPGVANSSSGAYGLCQALPASKMASAGADYLTNPITQLRWCSGYASGRYGGWAGAYSAWQVQGWW